MTTRRFFQLWRSRRSNPLARRVPVLPMLLLMAGVVACLGVFALFVGRKWIPHEVGALIQLALNVLFFPVYLQFFHFPLLAPRQRAEDHVEELLLTRMDPDEIAFGLVYAPLRAAAWIIVLAVLGSLPVSWWWVESISIGSDDRPIFMAMLSLANGAFLTVSLLAGLRGWQENPGRGIRNAFVSLLLSAWQGLHLFFLVIFGIVLVAEMNWVENLAKDNPGFVIGVGYLFCISFITSLVLAIFRRGGRGAPFVFPRMGRLVCLVLGASWIFLWINVWQDDRRVMVGFTAACLLFNAMLFRGFLRFFTPRALCRVYTEEYQDLCWSAPDDPRRGEWRDRLGLMRLLARRLGMVNLLRENTGVLLSAVLLVFLGFFLGEVMDRLTLLDSRAAARGETISSMMNGGLGFSMTFLLAVLLPAIRAWNESRLHPDGSVPVAKGAILASSIVYAAAPILLVCAHAFIGSAILGWLRGWDFGNTTGFILQAVLYAILQVAVVLLLIPHRRRILLLVITAIGAACLYSLSILLDAIDGLGQDRNPRYYFSLGDFGEMLRLAGVCALILLSAFGIPWLAQRVHDLETAGVPRFGFSGRSAEKPQERKPDQEPNLDPVPRDFV